MNSLFGDVPRMPIIPPYRSLRLENRNVTSTHADYFSVARPIECQVFVVLAWPAAPGTRIAGDLYGYNPARCPLVFLLSNLLQGPRSNYRLTGN